MPPTFVATPPPTSCLKSLNTTCVLAAVCMSFIDCWAGDGDKVVGNPGCLCPPSSKHVAYRIGRTMFEVDGLPAQLVDHCNAMDEVRGVKITEGCRQGRRATGQHWRGFCLRGVRARGEGQCRVHHAGGKRPARRGGSLQRHGCDVRLDWLGGWDSGMVKQGSNGPSRAGGWGLPRMRPPFAPSLPHAQPVPPSHTHQPTSQPIN